MSQKLYSSFKGKTNYKDDLPRVKDAICCTLRHVDIPSRIEKQGIPAFINIKELRYNLDNIRRILDKFLEQKDIEQYFYELISMTKIFKVANCGELAEIAKTALKMNGIKKCDIFYLYAKKNNNSNSLRNLGHAVTAVNISDAYNNKKTLNLFEVSPKTPIIDLWADNYTGNIGDVRDKYSLLKLEPDEQILFRPIRTIEPDKHTLDVLKHKFPSLII